MPESKGSHRYTIEWQPGIRLYLQARAHRTTAWEWLPGIWQETYDDYPIRALILRNWVYANQGFRERVLGLLERWSFLPMDTTFKVLDHKVMDRDLWVIFDWPECMELSAFLERHKTTPRAFIRHIMRSVLFILQRWSEHPQLRFQAHGYLMPESIFLLPGARVRLAPPLLNPADEEIFLTLWPFIPRGSSRFVFKGGIHDPRSDLFALGAILYQAVSGEHPWWEDSQGYPVYSLREPLFCRTPWLPPGLIQAIESLIEQPPDSYAKVMDYWNREPAPKTPRWVDWHHMLKEDKKESLEYVYTCYRRAQSVGDYAVSLFWGQLYAQMAGPETLPSSFLRTLGELRTQLPVVHPRHRTVHPLMARETVVPVAFEHRPALIFPFWHERMEEAFARGQLIEAVQDFLRLKKNRAPVKGLVSEFLDKLVSRLYTPEPFDEKLTEDLDRQSESLQVNSRKRSRSLIYRILLILFLLMGGISIFHQTGLRLPVWKPEPESATEYPDRVPKMNKTPAEMPSLIVCPRSTEAMMNLEKEALKAKEQKDWVRACDLFIQVLSCTSPQSPEYGEKERQAYEVCRKIVNPSSQS